MKKTLAMKTAGIALIASFVFASVASAEQALRKYRPLWSLTGKLTVAGSGTLDEELLGFADSFQHIYRGVEVAVVKTGSAAAPSALLNGTAQIGTMPRLMTREESAAIEQKYGAPPVAFLVGLDALAIFVHPQNEVRCLSLSQIDRIFSMNRLTGEGRAIATWGELGLSGDWRDRAIVAYGRRAGSITAEFFRNAVLGGDVLRSMVKTVDSGSVVVTEVGKDKFALGYSSIGFRNENVRAVPVTASGDEGCVAPDAENVARGRYPLTRSLYLYLLRTSDEHLTAVGAEFIRYILSRDGQLTLLETGLTPIGRDVQDMNMRKLKSLRSGRSL
jgi:phosphate transport system substrate-binding protein